MQKTRLLYTNRNLINKIPSYKGIKEKKKCLCSSYQCLEAASNLKKKKCKKS